MYVCMRTGSLTFVSLPMKIVFVSLTKYHLNTNRFTVNEIRQRYSVATIHRDHCISNELICSIFDF